MNAAPNQPVKNRRFVLRNLPFSARLTLATFLLAVGIGYVSAMVQLHMQHASPGNLLPSNDDVIRQFHGRGGEAKSKIEQLLEADESLPFNGTGSMAKAFTSKSDLWTSTIRDRATEKKTDRGSAEAELRAEREGERKLVIAWVRAGCPKDAFESNKFPLPADWGQTLLTPNYRDGDAVKIKTLFTDRCTRCHSKDGDDPEAMTYPMESYEQIQQYAKVDSGGGRVGLTKLAQTTHAHLLSFAVLFAFTGLLFALTNYPAPLRIVLSPLVLAAQVIEIACWWLARLDGPTGEMFARAIPILGMVVGGGLGAQIVLTLFHLFGAFGRVVLVLVFAVGGYGAYVAKEKVIDPFLDAKAEEAKK
jgi:hypothetical protein